MLLHSMAQTTKARLQPALHGEVHLPRRLHPGALRGACRRSRAPASSIRDIEILSLHYAETVKAWRERFLAQREKVLELYDERFIRMWDFYLAGSESAFRYDQMHVFHLQARPPAGAGAADAGLYPRGDGPARRGRARLARLCRAPRPPRGNPAAQRQAVRRGPPARSGRFSRSACRRAPRSAARCRRRGARAGRPSRGCRRRPGSRGCAA